MHRYRLNLTRFTRQLAAYRPTQPVIQASAFGFLGTATVARMIHCTPVHCQSAVTHPSESPMLTLYMYSVCPFCNKLKAFLDYQRIPYNTVEVGPLFKNELKFSDYKKVPVVVLHEAQGDRQLNDSSCIIDELTTHLQAAGKYRGAESAEEHAQWSQWADTKLVQALTVSIYRTPEESLQAMSYITAHPELAWQVPTKYVSAALMYVISHWKLKKKYEIVEERQNLYTVLEQWVGAVGKNQFLGGSAPSRQDLEVFGMLRAIESMDTFKDLQKNTSIAPWYDAMRAQVETQDSN